MTLTVVPVHWDKHWNGWSAVCPVCHDLVTFIGCEARTNGAVLPASVYHECSEVRAQ